MGNKLIASGKDLINKLDAYVAQGYITKQTHSKYPLTIYCYTNKTMFVQKWDNITKFARGVVLDNDGNVVSKPFFKFYNLGEKNCPKVPVKEKVTFWEKCDGSMGTAFWYNDQLIITTKASFDNPYVAYAYMQRELFEDLPRGYTYMFEIVVPEDSMARAVVHEPGLYLIGATNLTTMLDVDPEKFQMVWKGFWPAVYEFKNVDEAATYCETLRDTEGLVARFSSGKRIKIKTPWYLKLFRIINRLVPNILEGFAEGKSARELLLDIPEELQEQAEGLVGELQDRKHWLTHLVYGKFSDIVAEFDNDLPIDRKQFAKRVFEVCTKSEAKYMFLLLDNKSIDDQTRKQVVEEYAHKPKEELVEA